MYKRNSQGWTKHADFIIIDSIVLQLSYIMAYMIRVDVSLPYFSVNYTELAIMLAVVDILVAAVFNTMHNVMKRRLYKEMLYTAEHTSIVFAIMIVYLFSTRSSTDYSRIVLFLTFGSHFVFGYITRNLWKKAVHRINGSRPKTKMIIVAPESKIGEILDRSNPADEFEYAGIVLSDKSSVGEEIRGLKVVADLNTAADYFCREWVDEVFIYPEHFHELESYQQTGADENTLKFDGKEIPLEAGGKIPEGTIAALMEQCRQMAIPVHIRLPIGSTGGKNFLEKVGGYNVLTRSTNYVSANQLLLKRIIDILGGLVGSVMTLLVLAVVGPMIKKASPGPVLFKQTRIAQNGRKFKIYKIRTMYMDAEERKKELMSQNRVADGMMFKMDFDPRIIGNKIVDGKQVTGLGEFLRRSSIDELPQLFNVLKGEMSLVGTRPPTVDEWEKYKYHHRARLATKPGLTGMWQVSGRSDITDFEEVVRLDTEYINNWSLGLDIKILFKTVEVVLKHDGAM